MNANAAEVAQAILKKSPYGELRTIQCRMDADSIILVGVVSSFFYKQLAFQTLLGKVDGVTINTFGLEVKNNS